MAILLNGLVKDYNPAGGIDAASTLLIDPTAQPWSTGRSVACPQGDGAGLTIPYSAIGNVPFDGSFLPRVGQGDDGFYSTVASTVGGRFFSCNLKAKGASSTVEPSAPGVDGTMVWTTAVNEGFNWRNARANTTAYVAGDLVSQGTAIWRCLVGGTSAASPPAGYGTAQFGNTVSDGGALFMKFLVAGGAWAASTTYVGAQPQDTNTHLAAIGLTTVNGAFLIFNGVRGSSGTTGATEPSWSAATATQKYWADNDIVWIQGKDLFGNDGTAQAERLVMTGLAAAASNGKQITVQNGGSGNMDVVLADKNATNRLAVNETTGTDAASTHAFDLGGTDLALTPGQSKIVVYDTASGTWKSQVQGGGAVALAIKDVLNKGERGRSADLAIRIYDFTGDASYPTGGYTITASLFGLNTVFAIDAAPATDGAVAIYDPTTAKLKFFWSNASGSRLAEVTNGTSLTTTTCRGIVFGQ